MPPFVGVTPKETKQNFKYYFRTLTEKGRSEIDFILNDLCRDLYEPAFSLPYSSVFVCQLGGITWIQKLGKSEVLIGTKTKGDSWPLRSCPGVSQGYRQEQLHMTVCALVRKQPRSNRKKDPMPPDTEISEKQFDRLGEPCCLQPGVV